MTDQLEPDQETVEILEHYLRLARCGELQGVYVIGLSERGVVGASATGVRTTNATELVAVLTVKQFEIATSWHQEEFSSGHPEAALGVAGDDDDDQC